MKLLGLAGEAGSGKDTVADHLVEKHKFIQIAFADNLKKMCMEVFGLTHAQCYDQDFKEKKLASPVRISKEHLEKIIKYVETINRFKLTKDIKEELNKFYENEKVFGTARAVLQYMGTEVLRETIREDYHIEVVRKFIFNNKQKKIVITDARFPNERDVISGKWEGSTVVIERPLAKDKTVGIVGHASENSIGNSGDYDYVIDNSGTLDELYATVDELVDDINKV